MKLLKKPMSNEIHRYRRFEGWDYTRGASLFITIVSEPRRALFGEVEDGKVILSPLGERVSEALNAIPRLNPAIRLFGRVVMPDHIHFNCSIQAGLSEPLLVLGNAIRRFKNYTTKEWKLAERSSAIKSPCQDLAIKSPDPIPAIKSPCQDLAIKSPDQPSAIKSLCQDLAIKSPEQLSAINSISQVGFGQASKLWQQGYHDYILLSREMIDATERYIAYNPLKWDLMYGSENALQVFEPVVSPRLDAADWWKGVGNIALFRNAPLAGVFDQIRDLFASTMDAKAKGYSKGRFSFNVKGGRCEACCGDGIVKIEMHFLPDVYVPCEVCGGKRYNRETLDVHYKGKSIYDVLDMTVEEALGFFENVPSIHRKIQTLYDVGLSYVRLGQPSTTLSGGEAQRIKLATELSRKSTGRTIYILDEPTTGLHFADVHKLVDILARLADGGNTVLVIEHNLDVIKTADYIIDMGPEGGDCGGTVIASGTPEEVAECENSYTGKYIAKMLDKEKKRKKG